MPESRTRLTEVQLEEIESMARENAGEPYRGPLLALVGEVAGAGGFDRPTRSRPKGVVAAPNRLLRREWGAAGDVPT